MVIIPHSRIGFTYYGDSYWDHLSDRHKVPDHPVSLHSIKRTQSPPYFCSICNKKIEKIGDTVCFSCNRTTFYKHSHILFNHLLCTKCYLTRVLVLFGFFSVLTFLLLYIIIF